jgi:hypothetical protein
MELRRDDQLGDKKRLAGIGDSAGHKAQRTTHYKPHGAKGPAARHAAAEVVTRSSSGRLQNAISLCTSSAVTHQLGNADPPGPDLTGNPTMAVSGAVSVADNLLKNSVASCTAARQTAVPPGRL